MQMQPNKTLFFSRHKSNPENKRSERPCTEGAINIAQAREANFSVTIKTICNLNNLFMYKYFILSCASLYMAVNVTQVWWFCFIVSSSVSKRIAIYAI